MPAIVTAIAISMKDAVVNFGPPFVAGIVVLALLRTFFAPEAVAAALGTRRKTAPVLAGVAGDLGLVPAGDSWLSRVAGLAELATPLPAILLGGVIAPGIAAARFVAGLLMAPLLARIPVEVTPSNPVGFDEPHRPTWRRAIGHVTALLDAYGNGLMLAAVVAGAVGYLIPDGLVSAWLGGGRWFTPLVAVGLSLLTPAGGGAEVIVAATLLAKGADVSAALAMMIAAPILNILVFRRIASRLSVVRAATLGLTAAPGSIALALAMALSPGLQRI